MGETTVGEEGIGSCPKKSYPVSINYPLQLPLCKGELEGVVV